MSNSDQLLRKQYPKWKIFLIVLITVIVMHRAARFHQLNNSFEDPLSEFIKTYYFGKLNISRQARQGWHEKVGISELY